MHMIPTATSLKPLPKTLLLVITAQGFLTKNPSGDRDPYRQPSNEYLVNSCRAAYSKTSGSDQYVQHLGHSLTTVPRNDTTRSARIV
eukprot:9913268-Prorocentrum_lima.AAC.1